MSASEGC